jgi:hypothetical protein
MPGGEKEAKDRVNLLVIVMVFVYNILLVVFSLGLFDSCFVHLNLAL